MTSKCYAFDVGKALPSLHWFDTVGEAVTYAASIGARNFRAWEPKGHDTGLSPARWRPLGRRAFDNMAAALDKARFETI